eukprot:1138528-Pelagomonas_calceolata.AAC.1
MVEGVTDGGLWKWKKQHDLYACGGCVGMHAILASSRLEEARSWLLLPAADCRFQCRQSDAADCRFQCRQSDAADCWFQCRQSDAADRWFQCRKSDAADCWFQCRQSDAAD